MICQRILGQKWHKFWRNFFQQTLINLGDKYLAHLTPK
ncbi:hypothetical protein CWATWH8502_685 [Crocosphaera watsonii WH 8502]|uniref:Uncharacterized protein n=1 Tax=Crocosphaera watsonii WH 8502 TaxID=423474 RepID=T2I9A0_CROWT|nr:hypothetical protein CWATWH8502_685 [Crocosphaera watsonii WH 8502]